jgi:hypothetical protein
VVAEVLSEAEESFGGTKVRVASSALCYLLATDPVLLVSKGQRSDVDLGLSYIIQKWVRGGVHTWFQGRRTFDGDAGSTKGEGLGARGVGVPGDGVLRWTKEPVEGNDGEVDNMLLDLALAGIGSVEGREEFADDCDVSRVGSFGRVVLVRHPFEESLE